jgi:hypothetical protein
MREQDEDDPDDEPDAPDEPGDGAAQPGGVIPSVAFPTREWEYSTQNLSVGQLADGTTLVKTLKDAAGDGWELDQVVEAGEKRVLLLRRPKRQSRESRRVGFAPPSKN